MKVILSCTTTHERSDLFYYCSRSLMQQSFQPNIILINISTEPYLRDRGFSEVPEWMNQKGIYVNWVENTGSYRKLLPALTYADVDDLIITCDDDVIYGRTWLEQIIDAALADPTSIICAMGRKMKKNLKGNWQNYSQWSLIEEKTKGTFVIPIGCAGIVYKKRNLDLAFLLDRKYLDIAPTTDDLWFKMASFRKNVPVSVIPEINNDNTYFKNSNGLDKINLEKINSSSSSSLSRFFERLWFDIAGYCGVNQSQNDFSWDAICKYAKFIDSQEKSIS